MVFGSKANLEKKRTQLGKRLKVAEANFQKKKMKMEERERVRSDIKNIKGRLSTISPTRRLVKGAGGTFTRIGQQVGPSFKSAGRSFVGLSMAANQSLNRQAQTTVRRVKRRTKKRKKAIRRKVKMVREEVQPSPFFGFR